MKIEDGLLLAGALNDNYVYASERGPYIMRVQQRKKDLIQEWKSSIYPFIGFFQDGGRMHIRTPREQYDFSRRAACEGLRVLAADELSRGTLRLAFLPEAQQLDAYLYSHPNDQTRIINQLFADLRRAHAKGLVYGDRWSPNILVNHRVQGKPEIVHIDFDIEISGPTAKELEIAEVSRDLLCVGETTLEPLARWLAAPQAWFDLDTVSKYLSNYADHWRRDRFRLAPGDLIERLLTTAYTIRGSNTELKESHFAISALHSRMLGAGG